MRELWHKIKRNMLSAAKSVRYNLRLCLPFFAALFIAQIFLGILLFSSAAAAAAENAIIADTYDHHVAFYSINEDQYLYLKRYAVSNGYPDAIYEIQSESAAAGSTTSEPRYDVTIRLTGDPSVSYEDFSRMYLPYLRGYADGGADFYETTPLLTRVLPSSVWPAAELVLLLLALSFALLTVLNLVRIHHDKFEYGIYMTFGADFRKLFENALYELTWFVLIPYLPAVLISAAAVSILYGRLAPVRFGALLLILILPAAAGLAACLFPLFLVSKGYPIRHLKAEDSSDYVISPRTSFRLKAGAPLRRFGRISFFRFRKYFLPLALTASLFTVSAVMLFYFSGFLREKEAQPAPQFRLTFVGGDWYGEEEAESLRAVPGVFSIYTEASTDAAVINSHLMFLDGEADVSALSYPERFDLYFAAGTDHIAYYAANDDVISYLSGFRIEGDPTALLRDDRAVVIGENRNNSRVLTVKPGDKIYAAVPMGRNPASRTSAEDLSFLTGDALFRAKLEIYDYQYIELTVAAVLKDYPTGDNVPVFLSEAGYRFVTQPKDADGGRPVRFRSVDIYADPGLDGKGIAALGDRIATWADAYGTVAVRDLHADASALIRRALKQPVLCIESAFLILMLVPTVWFFAQSVFYRKRWGETEILRALGATGREIRALYRQDGLFAAGLVAVLTGLLTAGGALLLYRTLNRAAGAALYYHQIAPPWLIPAAMAVSAVCAAASAAVSLCRYEGAHADKTETETIYAEE